LERLDEQRLPPVDAPLGKAVEHWIVWRELLDRVVVKSWKLGLLRTALAPSNNFFQTGVWDRGRECGGHRAPDGGSHIVRRLPPGCEGLPLDLFQIAVPASSFSARNQSSSEEPP